MGRHFNLHDFLEGHVLIGMIMSLVSVILLLLVTFSTPFTDALFFLEARGVLHGMYGLCFSDGASCEHRLGYDTGPELTEWMTRTHILFSIACIFMIAANVYLVLSLAQVPKYKWDSIYFRTSALLGSLTSGLASIFALINFVQARQRFKAQGVEAHYGPSLWSGLAAFIAAFTAACIGGPRITAGYMYRANNGVAYNV